MGCSRFSIKKDAEGNFLEVPESNMMIRLADSAMDILQDLWHPNNICGALERMRG